MNKSTQALLVLVTACSMAGVAVAGDRQGKGGRGQNRAGLFVSPSGQPFRSSAGEPYPVQAWFAAADRNGDGRLDKAEFLADAEAYFHVLDQGRDGDIGGLEITRYETEIVPEMVSGSYGELQSQRSAELASAGISSAPTEALPLLRLASFNLQSGGGGGQGGGRGKRQSQPENSTKRNSGPTGSPRGAAPYGLLNQPEPVTTADRNFDGRITLAEFLSNADRNFGLLDVNRQGYLTLQQLPRTPTQR